MELKKCKAHGCGKDFQPRTVNQIYCNPDCLKLETNRRLLIDYHDKRNKKSPKGQKCSTDKCITLLSSYNNHAKGLCELCQRREFEKKLRKYGFSQERIEDMEL